jgi:antitoxin (DNA-binding transcriptional repressor) of toxin-antitoxin stability system
VDRAEAGETVRITRRGKLVARLVPPEPKKKRIDVEALRKFTESMPRQPVSAGEFIRKMRDEDRY